MVSPRTVLRVRTRCRRRLGMSSVMGQFYTPDDRESAQCSALCDHEYEVPKDIHQGFVLVVGKLTCIKIHPVLAAGFILNVWLVRVAELSHCFAAARALDVPDFVQFFTDPGIAVINIIGHPFIFEGFSFADVKPYALAVGAAVHGDATTQGAECMFLHWGFAFGTLHR